MKKFIGITILLATVALFSCQNEKIDNPTTDEEILSEKSAQITLGEVQMENALTETEYEIDFYANACNSIFAQFRMGHMWQWTNKLRYGANQCPNVTFGSEDDTYPKTITLDYGESTTLRNGKELSGIIVIEITAPRNSAEYQRNITFDNFGVDTLLINGSAVVTIDREDEMFRTFTTDVEIMFDNGTTITRTSERTWQWIAGMDSELDQTDDVIEITGSATAVTPTGDTYTKEITEPLIRTRDCRYIVQGVVEITLNDELISSLDYGDGTCDNIAILTKDGETAEVDLAACKITGNGFNNGMHNGAGMGNGENHQNGNASGAGNGNQHGQGNTGGNQSGNQSGNGNQHGQGNGGGGMHG